MNKFLQFCLIAVCAAAPLAAGDKTALGEDRVRIGVRADRRSGRLVRSVVIEPMVVATKTPGAMDAVSSGAKSSLALSKDKKINELVEQAARQYELDPLLVHAVIAVESGYNQYAISPMGAQGLMQLMPSTARQLGVRNSFDMEENIRAGVKHLKDLKAMYGDDRLVLAAYNAGAGAVDKYRWIPPYPETQEYVYKVGKRYGEARRSAALQTPVMAKAETVKVEPAPLVEEKPRAVESFVDAQGRLFMRTK